MLTQQAPEPESCILNECRATDLSNTLQLWVFPKKQNAKPRYDQKSFDIETQINTFVKERPKIKMTARQFGFSN